MKQLSALKLKNLVSTQLDLSEMGNLIGGIEDGIMLLAYGCESDVCSKDSSASQSHCSTESCRVSTCTSGA